MSMSKVPLRAPVLVILPGIAVLVTIPLLLHARTPRLDQPANEIRVAGVASGAGLAEADANVSCPVGDASGMFPDAAAHNAMFERLAADTRYQVEVFSRDPWIVQLDGFLSAAECTGLLAECDDFVPDVTLLGANNKWRNSSSWNCAEDSHRCSRPGIRLYRERVGELLGVGMEYSEGLAVLRYNEGGFYLGHHDYIPDFKPGCGPRVLTVMAYLTDVERGGHTDFIFLPHGERLSVAPKVGRLLVWANTYAHKPLEQDMRTAHEAMVVDAGTKVTATMWFQQYDRKANERAKCCPPLM